MLLHCPVEHASNELGDRRAGLVLVMGLWQKQDESKGDTSTRGRSDDLKSFQLTPHKQTTFFYLVNDRKIHKILKLPSINGAKARSLVNLCTPVNSTANAKGGRLSYSQNLLQTQH